MVYCDPVGSSFITALVRGELEALLAYTEEKEDGKDADKVRFHSCSHVCVCAHSS